jgi:deoxyribodipyrimidine photolyase-related protein
MIFLLFPTQLFSDLSLLSKSKLIYLIEEPRYFDDFGFHKLKLAYHRASMKKYYDMLKKKKLNVKYIDCEKVNNNFYKSIKSENDLINIFYPGDFPLQNKLENIFGKKLVINETLNFLIKTNEFVDIKKLIYKNTRYSHDEFYKYQRKKLSILIDKNNKPTGGKWSFDSENRLPLPANIKVPDTVSKVKSDKYIKEAIKYVNKNWSKNYGSLDHFIYPIDSKASKLWLNKFLEERLSKFGAYEDAVSEAEPFVFHSVISPMMNIGLLTDDEVVNTSYEYYLDNKKTIPIESFEGFIRQVIGWRNYVYTLYNLEGEKMKTTNQLKHNNKINDKFWTGQTDMIPIDSIINKIVKYSYAHHIERLMYLGNFLLLCLVDPDEVYRIFMEWTIDAYDWVMVPNVYGMSQFATPIMMTRPYFSSSNYINKMSTFKVKKNDNWSETWDALYYNFIFKHRNLLKSNYAVARQVKHWDNKSESEQNEIKKKANEYLNKLFK